MTRGSSCQNPSHSNCDYSSHHFSVSFNFRPFEFNGVHFVFYYPYLDVFQNFAMQILHLYRPCSFRHASFHCSATCFYVDRYNNLLADNNQADIWFISPAFDKQPKGAEIINLFLLRFHCSWLLLPSHKLQ
jgi:hypothetical protein